MISKGTYDHPNIPISADYIYIDGEPDVGIPRSVQITAIWHKGVDISDVLLEVNTDWVARLEEEILRTKTLI